MCEPEVKQCPRCKRFFHVGWIAYHNCLFYLRQDEERAMAKGEA